MVWLYWCERLQGARGYGVAAWCERQQGPGVIVWLHGVGTTAGVMGTTAGFMVWLHGVNDSRGLTVM
eukprot:285693-Chlamydomonas_euryale.AAC.2